MNGKVTKAFPYKEAALRQSKTSRTAMPFLVAVILSVITATHSCIASDAPGFLNADFEALLNNHIRTIILCLPSLPKSRIHHDKLSAWLSRLPLPIELWTHFDHREIERLENWTADNVKVAVLVPWSSSSTRNSILKRIKGAAIFISLVKLVFFLRPTDTISYIDLSDIACLTVFVEDKENVTFPRNDNNECADRPSQGMQLFPTENGRGLSALRDKTFVVADKSQYQGHIFPPGNYNYPCIDAVMKTLPFLNITILPEFYTLSNTTPDQISLDLMRKKIDVIVSGAMESNERYRYVFVGAVTYCTQLKFFSKTRSLLSFSVMATFNNSRSFGVFLLLGIMAIVLFHFVEMRLLNRATDLGDVFLFLVSAVLNRTSPLQTSLTRLKTGLLCTIWLIAMICIGAYIQSALTSESSIPPGTSTIDTISKLQQLVDSGHVLPCVRANDFGHKYITSEADGLAISLHKPLKEFPESCIGAINGTQCFDRSSKDTHVFIDGVLGGIDLRNAAKHGLIASSEVISHSCQAVLVAKNFPYTQELVRLAGIISQSGLIDYEGRRDLWENPLPLENRDAKNSMQSSFVEPFCLYIFGVLLSITVFVVELFSRRLCERSRNHRRVTATEP